MTKISGDYLVTDEAEVKVKFYGERLMLWDDKITTAHIKDKAFCDDCTIGIPCALVCEVVRQPIIDRVEGGEFWFPKTTSEEWPDSDPPEYSWRVTTNQNPNYYYIADNAITAGRNTGDLRKLVQWIIGTVVQGTTQGESCDNVLGEQGSKEFCRRWTVTHRDTGERRG